MTATAFTFDADTHTYRLDGQRLPSVTEVISAAGMIDYSQVPADVLEFARVRGTLLHKATALWDRGELDEDTVDPEIAPRLEGWKNFTRDAGFVPIRVERYAYSPTQLFCGMYDRYGHVRPGGRYVLDIKPEAQNPATGIQLAAYHHLIGDRSAERLSVHLKADGRYKVKTYPARELEADWQTFLAALRIWKWRRLNKV